MSITERIKKLEAKAFSLQESSTSPVLDLQGARWCFGCGGLKPLLDDGGPDCKIDIEGARRVFALASPPWPEAAESDPH